jgi:hypothetical protein
LARFNFQYHRYAVGIWIKRIKETVMAKENSNAKDSKGVKKGAATKPAADAKAGAKKRGRPAKAK